MNGSRLSSGDQDALLQVGLPYHIQGLVLLILADQQHAKIEAGEEVRFDLNGNSLAPNILLNALYEAGIVHLRYLAEFLGLKVGPSGNKSNARRSNEDDLRVDDLSKDNFVISPLTWEALTSRSDIDGKFSDALQLCLTAANKRAQHPTKHLLGDQHIVGREELHMAVTGIATLLMNMVYEPLGLTKFLLQVCPGIEHFRASQSSG